MTRASGRLEILEKGVVRDGRGTGCAPPGPYFGRGFRPLGEYPQRNLALRASVPRYAPVGRVRWVLTRKSSSSRGSISSAATPKIA
jgi:hypothetical protein